MIELRLSRTVDEIRGPRDHACRIEGDIRGVAITRESLKHMFKEDELGRLPNRSVFSVAMDGGNLRASCDPEVPLTVDGTAILPMHHHVLKDRGQLTLVGMIFTYTVSYI